jgi:hypothetical protein
MAVFCQVGRPLPPHRHEFLSQHALSVRSVLQVHRVGGTAFSRRLTLLISAGWVPHRLWFVAELPRSRRGRVSGADVHNDFEDSPPARDAADPTDLLRSRLRGGRRHLPGDRPDEARQLTRDGRRRFRFRFPARDQTTEPRRQSPLRLPRDVAHALGQRLLAVEHLPPDPWNPLIRPRGFREQSPGVRIAGLGNPAAPDARSTRVF